MNHSNWLQEEFEDTEGVIRIRKSKKNRQHNGQKKKYKRTNNDLQDMHIQTKDRVTRTPLKTGGQLRCTGRVDISCDTRCVTLIVLKKTVIVDICLKYYYF